MVGLSETEKPDCEVRNPRPEGRGEVNPFGPSGVYYSTCHGIVREEEAFASKIEMLDAMIFPKGEELIDQEKLLDFFVVKVMQATKGKADPYQVRQVMQDMLDSYRLTSDL